jgi:hypothetical protein
VAGFETLLALLLASTALAVVARRLKLPVPVDARTAMPLFLLIATGGAVVGWVVYRVVRQFTTKVFPTFTGPPPNTGIWAPPNL